MSDFHLVEPQGWDCDLHSIYCAYVGHFQEHGTPWYERSWGVFFETFEDFLTFEWPVITVTDMKTGRPHIVTRMSSVDGFLKMIKTRHGETLPKVHNIHFVTPFETNQRHLRKISDAATYKKVHATLPAARLAAQKVRARSGEPKTIRQLWDTKDQTFLAMDFEWSERNSSTVLEWGYAAMRCSALHAANIWPPQPENNYRRGHYVVGEHVDRIINRHQPTFPWAYAFGDSQVIPKAQLPRVIQAIISSLASPDSETTPNSLVLVGHGLHEDLRRLQEMEIKIPHNVLMLDTASYERQLFASGQRNAMTDPSGKPRAPHSTLSLTNLIRSLGVDIPWSMHNAGNDAMVCLLALQLLLEPEGTKMPKYRPVMNMPMSGLQVGIPRAGSKSPGVPSISLTPSPGGSATGMRSASGSGGLSARPRELSGSFDRAPSPVRRLPGNSFNARRRSTMPDLEPITALTTGVARIGFP
ncbi:uncharacterized protein C8Q71DRAFT_599256 [Rhodofomes roseus]|uniref:Exonuclease domain-containing protein n=1 Tax=Rhodofomes roseus TaxID=34475 RepID=A0ABQ8KHT2_9APHY|nr:uncharacterized protein C8Q71DRAFT_599256 [Rhodofomes roseus]KAH9837383.1 hypothetical protein C8Q71DRAFT_599256 [Rhodofomes roseus]